MSGHLISSAGDLAAKPFSIKLLSAVLIFSSMSEPTWWFVITSPLGETIEPEPPLEMRTHDFCKCSSHAALGSKLYFSLSCFSGGLLKGHMPSSATAETERPSVATRPNVIVDARNCMRGFMDLLVMRSGPLRKRTHGDERRIEIESLRAE